VVIDAFVKIKPTEGSGDVIIGRGTIINSGCVLYTGHGMRIGHHVLVAANCRIGPPNHRRQSAGQPTIHLPACLVAQLGAKPFKCQRRRTDDPPLRHVSMANSARWASLSPPIASGNNVSVNSACQRDEVRVAPGTRLRGAGDFVRLQDIHRTFLEIRRSVL
jgi:hypothetical protein